MAECRVGIPALVRGPDLTEEEGGEETGERAFAESVRSYDRDERRAIFVTYKILEKEKESFTQFVLHSLILRDHLIILYI